MVMNGGWWVYGIATYQHTTCWQEVKAPVAVAEPVAETKAMVWCLGGTGRMGCLWSVYMILYESLLHSQVNLVVFGTHISVTTDKSGDFEGSLMALGGIHLLCAVPSNGRNPPQWRLDRETVVFFSMVKSWCSALATWRYIVKPNFWEEIAKSHTLLEKSFCMPTGDMQSSTWKKFNFIF